MNPTFRLRLFTLVRRGTLVSVFRCDEFLVSLSVYGMKETSIYTDCAPGGSDGTTTCVYRAFCDIYIYAIYTEEPVSCKLLRVCLTRALHDVFGHMYGCCVCHARLQSKGPCILHMWWRVAQESTGKTVYAVSSVSAVSMHYIGS